MSGYKILVQYSIQENVFIEADSEEETFDQLNAMFSDMDDMEVLSVEEEKNV